MESATATAFASFRKQLRLIPESATATAAAADTRWPTPAGGAFFLTRRRTCMASGPCRSGLGASVNILHGWLQEARGTPRQPENSLRAFGNAADLVHIGFQVSISRRQETVAGFVQSAARWIYCGSCTQTPDRQGPRLLVADPLPLVGGAIGVLVPVAHSVWLQAASTGRTGWLTAVRVVSTKGLHDSFSVTYRRKRLL